MSLLVVVISILLFWASPIVIYLQLILLGKLFTIVVSSGSYCCSFFSLVPFPTASPLAFVPLASNFATQIPVNSLCPNVNPGCTTFVVLVFTLAVAFPYEFPSLSWFVFPAKNVIFISFSVAVLPCWYPLVIWYAYLGIHTYILPNSSSCTTCPSPTCPALYLPSLNMTFAHFLLVVSYWYQSSSVSSHTTQLVPLCLIGIIPFANLGLFTPSVSLYPSVVGDTDDI